MQKYLENPSQGRGVPLHCYLCAHRLQINARFAQRARCMEKELSQDWVVIKAPASSQVCNLRTHIEIGFAK